MSVLKDIPGWGQLLLAFITALVVALLAWGDLKGDMRVEATERRTTDDTFKESIAKIEQMLKEEMDRHHPRQP